MLCGLRIRTESTQFDEIQRQILANANVVCVKRQTTTSTMSAPKPSTAFRFRLCARTEWQSERGRGALEEFCSATQRYKS